MPRESALPGAADPLMSGFSAACSRPTFQRFPALFVGATVGWLIRDDDRIPPKGKRMAWVSQRWDHKQREFARGHVAPTAANLCRGVALPWRVERWKPKGQAGTPRSRKLTDMAAARVKAFEPPRA